jgi:putative hydrolase of HD superfamily
MELSLIQPPLRFSEGTEHIWEGLEKIPRTGWVQWGIPNPETVAEHVLATRRLAVAWRRDIELSDTEFDDMLAIVEVHDWPEVIAGDLVIMGDEHNVIELRNSKRDKEKTAMRDLCKEIPRGEEVMQLYERYETNADLPAQYAKQFDKIQAVLLAKEYEKEFQKEGLLKEFVAYTERYLDIPFLIGQLEKIRTDI